MSSPVGLGRGWLGWCHPSHLLGPLMGGRGQEQPPVLRVAGPLKREVIRQLPKALPASHLGLHTCWGCLP